MLRLILFLFLLLVSVGLGITLSRHPGFVFIVLQPWMVQMPLWFAVLSLFILFGLFYFLIHFIDVIQFWAFRLKNWLRFRREHKSYSKTQYGLVLLIEGRWKKAERLLLSGVTQTMEPLMNYLGAAKAAHEQAAYARRDSYIQKAYEVNPHADLAIGLTQAELELEQDQLEQAVATLNRLRQQSPRHPRVLKLLEKVYVRLADWQALQALLPSMRKAKLLNTEQLEQFEKNLYSEILRSHPFNNLEALHQYWSAMPRHVKKNPDVVDEYVKRLSVFPETAKEIEELIRKTLKHHWQPALVTQYGTLPINNLNRQLVIAGAWLKMYGPRPELLLLLGKLCVRVQLWGKAKDYFQRCLALGPNATASLEYGRLLDELGEREQAMQAYADGLASLAKMEVAQV
jgi:HemY protein